MKHTIGIVVVTCVMWSAMAIELGAQTPRQEPGSRGPRGGPFDLMQNPLVTAIDANSDGELSVEEITNSSEALKKLDKNSDGNLTRDELGPQPGGRGGPGRSGGRGPGGRGGLGGPAGSNRFEGLESSSLPKDDAEQKILKSLEEINQSQGRMMNVPPQDGRLLRLLVESIGAKNVVEIGTSNGISAIWICTALRKTGGKLITHEIEPDVAALARKNFTSTGVADLVTVVEGDAHEKVADLKGPIDLVFIDADKEGYLDYLTKVLPLVREGGLILAHNVNPRMADPRFLKAITTDPVLETIFYTEGGGMSVSLKKR